LAPDLRSYLEEKRARVDTWLRDLCDKDLVDCPEALSNAIRYSLFAPCKRLRPILVIMAAEACGAEDIYPLPAACAVEMVHTYSLVHDDLPAMDNDDLRRGLPTSHKKWGESTAILTGDALLTLAFQVLADNYPPQSAAGCCLELAKGAGATGMVGGQYEDLAWEKGKGKPKTTAAPDLKDLENIHARKTGALFRASLRLGAWSAIGEEPGGPDPAILTALDGYGRAFGQAFQITDDLLDVCGNAAETGKRVQKDAARGKLTYPGFLGIDESRRRAESLCKEAGRCLARFGSRAEYLAALCAYILERKH
jgi:geranylgeranyl diphosphate synthase type II